MAEQEQIEKDLDAWKKHWEDGDILWHKNDPNPVLIEYFGECLVDGRPPVTFVPLCGKSVDMKWLYDQGCEVCGVDVSEMAIKAFFDEQGIRYNSSTVSHFPLYSSEDGRLRIFCGDIYKFTKEQTGCQFDFIWDRAAFVAINICDRKRYVNALRELLLPTGRILLHTYNYDPAKWPGPPHYVTQEDVQDCFGSHFNIIHLFTRDCLTKERQERSGIDWMTESCHLISVKVP